MKTIEQRAQEAWEDYCYTSEGNLYSSVFQDGYKQGAEEALRSQWRPVDELPEDYVTVLVKCEYGTCLGTYDRPDEEWYIDGFGVAESATHWMPIPECK